MTPANTTRSAIYMRVSKDDGSQETDNQLLVLREEIERDGEQLVEVYVDRETGTKGRRERSDFDRMFRDVERRRFDLLRFGRSTGSAAKGSARP